MDIEADLAAQAEKSPDYDYGNRSPIQVVRLKPRLHPGLDPHSSFELDNSAGTAEKASWSEAELEEKVREIALNYRVIGDPKAAENNLKQFGATIVNDQKMKEGVPAILVMSTHGSSLYDEEGKPNNEGNALELAYTALKYPDRPVVYIESPGSGNSSDLTHDEYRQAAKDGKLIHDTRDEFGRITDFEAFETMQALARALEGEDWAIDRISANASGAHFVSALAAALPDNLERSFIYNPTNISDRSALGLSWDTLLEIKNQKKYEETSRDPLKLTEERKAMARRVMGLERKSRLVLTKGKTHNPLKLWRQQKIFRRGNIHGQSAAAHATVGQIRHPNALTTYVFPEFAAHYKDPKDIKEFIWLIERLGGFAVDISDIESLKIPLGQYGHSHYPSVRQTLEGYGFNR